MPFYQSFNRQEATQWIHKNPHRPVLRPCGYTATLPNILAVTYMFDGSVHHSLVEKDGLVFHGITVHQHDEVRRTRTRYASVSDLEDVLTRLSMSLPTRDVETNPISESVPIDEGDPSEVISLDPC